MPTTNWAGSRKLIGAVAAMFAILGALIICGFFGLSDFLTGGAIATIGSLGGAQVIGQAWIDRNNGGVRAVDGPFKVPR